jgi:peptidoglycan/LPS O-acetylase OafA/YrhL
VKGPVVKTSDRYPVLDGLRATSILLVLSGHMLPLGPKSLQLNETAATMGMSLFFALSGFLIATLLLHNPDVVEFAAKRLGRIVPLAFAYTFFVFIFLHWDPEALFWTAAFLVNYVPSQLINYNAHLWSLCVEVQFYIAIALIVLLGGRSAIWIVWPACLAVTAMRVSQGAYIHIQTHLRVDEILAGACVATIYNSAWKDRLSLPTITALVAAIGWFLSASPHTGWLQYLRPYATGSLMAAVLCHGNTPLARVLASAWMRYVATISYALYVIHPLSLQGWLNQGTALDRYLLKRPLSFALTFIAAHLSTFYWERPCLNAVNKWVKQRRLRRSRLMTVESNAIY